MCFGRAPAPQTPQIVYQGPSDADIQANQQALTAFQNQIAQQQTDFQTMMQEQIDQANKDAEDLQAKYSAELDTLSSKQAAEAAAAGAMNTNSAYAVTAAQSAPPEAAQTTQTVKKKEKPKNNLKISTAALPSSGGTGLNIGV